MTKAPRFYNLDILFCALAMPALILAGFWCIPAGGPPPALALRPPTIDYAVDVIEDAETPSAQGQLSGPSLADTIRLHPDLPATSPRPLRAPAAPTYIDPRVWDRDPLVRI